MDKLRAVADLWKKVNKLTNDKKEELTKCISEQENFQENYASCMEKLQGMTESLVSDTSSPDDLMELENEVQNVLDLGRSILSKIPDSQKPTYSERIEALSKTWAKAQELKKRASEIQEQLAINEEKSNKIREQCKAFESELEHFNQWLDSTEEILKTDMFSVPEEKQMEEIKKHERVYNELQQNSLVVNDLMEKGRKLSTSVPEEEREHIKHELETLSHRWTYIKKLSDDYGSQMEECIAEQSVYYNELENCVKWMQEAGAAIALFELETNDEDAVKKELSSHLELCGEIERRKSCIESVLEKGKGLVGKLPSEEKEVVKEQLVRLEEEWTKLQEQANDKKKELKEYLGEASDDEAQETPGIIGLKQELDDRLLWVQQLIKSFPDGKESSRSAFNLESDSIEALIEKAEAVSDTLAGPEKKSLNERLDKLKENWVALKCLLSGRRRRLGRQGSETESKQMKFGVQIAQLQMLIDEIKSKVLPSVSTIDPNNLDGTSEEFEKSRENLEEGKKILEKLSQLNDELKEVSEDENQGETNVTTNEALMNDLKKEFDSILQDFENQELEVKNAVSNLQRISDEMNKVETQIASKKERFDEIVSLDSEPDVEVHNLQALLQEVELCEAQLSVLDSESKNLLEELGNPGQVLTTRTFDLFDKIQKFKTDVNETMEQNQVAVEENQNLDDKLQRCMNLISQAEAKATEEIHVLEIPVLEKQVEEANAALVSSEIAAEELLQKSDSMLGKLKPGQRKAKEAELSKLQRVLGEVKEKSKENVDAFNKKLEGKKEYGKHRDACAQWISDIEKQFEDNEDDKSSPQEKIEKLKDISCGLLSEDSPVQSFINFAHSATVNASDAEKVQVQSDIEKFRSMAAKIDCEVKTKIELQAQETMKSLELENTVQELIVWLMSKEEQLDMIMNGIKRDSLKDNLQSIKNIESEMKSRKEDIDEVVKKGNERKDNDEKFKMQVLTLQNLFENLQDKVIKKGDLLNEHERAMDAFDEELSKCKTVVSELQELNSEDVPVFESVEELQCYLDDRIKRFSEIVQQSDCIPNIDVIKATVDCSDLDGLKEYTETQKSELIDRWEALQVQFTEKALDIRSNLALQQELSSSFSEVSSWIESAEEEISSLILSAEKVDEMSDSIKKLKELNEETLSYESFVKSLKMRVEKSSVDLNSSCKDSNESKVTTLQDKISSLQTEVSQKLKEVEGYLGFVQDVEKRVSECMEWLQEKEETFKQELPTFTSSEEVQTKLDECRNLTVEISSLIDKLNKGKEQLENGYENISPVLRESLLSDLENVSQSMANLECQVQERIKNLEICLSENRILDDSIVELEHWLDRSEPSLSADVDTAQDPLENLNELSLLQEEMPIKEEKISSIENQCKSPLLSNLQSKKLDDVKKRISTVKQSLAGKMDECKSKVEEIKSNQEQLEKCCNWISEAEELMCSETPFDVEDGSEDLVHEKINKVKKLVSDLPVYKDKVQGILNSEVLQQASQRDDDMRSKLENLTAKLENVGKNASNTEKNLVAFKQGKTDFVKQLQHCTDIIARMKEDSNDVEFSVNVDTTETELTRQKGRIEQLKAFETEIAALEDTSRVIMECQPGSSHDALKNQIDIVKEEWQAATMEAIMKHDDTETWLADVQELNKTRQTCRDQIEAVWNTIDDIDIDSADISGANRVLGDLKSAQAELEAVKNDLDCLSHNAEQAATLTNVDEQNSLEENLKDLKDKYHRAEDKLSKEIAEVQQKIHDFAKFEKDSAHCESMLTIYKAAIPADLSCTVETLESQMEKLKRLKADMDERESHMIDLREQSDKFSADHPTCDSKASKRASQISEDWGKLRKQLDEKLKELQRLSDGKCDFDKEYSKRLTQVEGLERALDIEREGSVSERIDQVQQLCSSIESFREELDHLSGRVAEVPAVAYEQDDDPKAKLNVLTCRWEATKNKASDLKKKLEKEKTDQKGLCKDLTDLEQWVVDVTTSIQSPPSMDPDEDPFESAVLENMARECSLDEKAFLIDRLSVRANEMKNDPEKTDMLEKVDLLSQKLEEARSAITDKNQAIQHCTNELNQIAEEIGEHRFVMDDIKASLSSDVIVDDDTIMKDKIGTFKASLAKIELGGSKLHQSERRISEIKRDNDCSFELKIEAELESTTDDMTALQSLLKGKLSLLEQACGLKEEFVEHAQVCKEYLAELGEELKADEECDLESIKIRLETCQTLSGKVNKTKVHYEHILAKSTQIMTELPPEGLSVIQDWLKSVESTRNELQCKLSTCCESLKAAMSEKQSLEDWINESNKLIENSCALLGTESFSLDETKVNAKILDLQVLIPKLMDSQAIGESLTQTSSSPSALTALQDVQDTRNRLEQAEKSLREFLRLRSNFEDVTKDLETILEKCQMESSSPKSPADAICQINSYKVGSHRFLGNEKTIQILLLFESGVSLMYLDCA